MLISLQRLVNALGTQSPSSYPFLLPLLNVCTDPGQVSTAVPSWSQLVTFLLVQCVYTVVIISGTSCLCSLMN